MPIFQKNGALITSGDSLRGCCCGVEPPPPPPPPEPPGPVPPPPPIPPGDPPPLGCGCCLVSSESTGDETFERVERVVFYGQTSLSCIVSPQGSTLGTVSFQLDGDHTCRDNRDHGLRDEYIVGKFTVGQRPVFDANSQIVEHCYGSLGFSATLRTFYNRYSSCSGSTVDDNARTPTTLVTYTVLEGVANINGQTVAAGQTYTAPGIPFNPNPGRQDRYTGGRVDTLYGEAHQNPGSGRITVPSQVFIPPHNSQHASIMSVHRLTWYHHDDYDAYVAVKCGSPSTGWWNDLT